MSRKSTRKERFRNVYQAAEPLRVAKRNTIHTLAGVGRRHKILRYPLLAGLIVFVFLYNLFLYLFMELKAEEKAAKALSVIMTVILVITSVDLTVFAMSQRNEDFYRVVSFEETNNFIQVPYGTQMADIVLPETVNANLDFYRKTENVTEAVPTEVPATEVLATEVPATEAPATEAPATEAPATEAPATEAPVTEAPATEAPATEAPVTEAPATEAPVTEEPATDTPVEETPSAETPAPEEPIAAQVDVQPEVESETVVREAETVYAELNLDVKAGEIVPVATETPNVVEVPTVTEAPNAVEASATTEAPKADVPGAQENKITEITETYIETVNAELVVQWECAEYDGQVPGEYVFTAKLPKEYNGCRLETGDTVLPVLKVQVMEPEVLTLSETVDGIEITLAAAPGVFPADARLSVTKIVDEESIAKIENAIQNTMDAASDSEEESATVEKIITFDIVVLDKNGQEIQPEIPEGMNAQEAVTVTFKQVVSMLSVELSEEEEDAVQTMEVFYVDDAMENAEQMDTNVTGEDLSINPEHFSLYSCICRVSGAKSVYSWTSLYKAVYGKTGTVNIKLGEDIDISKKTFYSNSDRLYIKNGQTVNLDLNGCTLRGTVSGKAAIEVKSGGTLNIYDTWGDGTISAPNGSYVIYANGGTVNLKGGSIRRGGSETYGIYVANNSWVNVAGGCISGTFPYGIYFNSSYRGTGTLSSGSIDGASYGVYIGGSTDRETAFTMTDGEIKNCKSVGIYNNSGSVTMSGGTISGNSGYKAYGIQNTGKGKLSIGGAVKFSSNRAADIYVGSSSTNYINVTGELTGSSIGVETAVAPTTEGAQFTWNVISETTMKKFYSAANSSYAVWQPNGVSYYVVGPKANCTIKVQPKNAKDSTAAEAMAGTVAIGTGAASTTAINTTVKYNASVTLKATLTNAEEYEFTGWKVKDGTTEKIVSTNPIYTFTATNDYEYTAVFTKKKYTITVGTSSSTRGSAAITGYSLGAVPSDRKFEVGSTITITATVNSGYRFAQWNDGDSNPTREEVKVTGNATYTAQFKKPDPDPNAEGEIFAGVKECTSNPAVGTNLLIIGGGDKMEEFTGNVAVAGLPDDSARVTAVSDGTYSTSWKTSSAGISPSGGRQVTIQKKPDGSLYRGNAFDTCPGGLINYYNGSWYYWCQGGSAVVGAGPYKVYSYTTCTTFKAGNVTASLNDLHLSADQSAIKEADITITVKKDNTEYTLKNLIFEDKAIDYSHGDRRVELNLGGVAFTYTLPEAIVVKKNGTRTEYDTLEKAIKAATEEGDKIYVVGSAVSEITNAETTLKKGVTIESNDYSKITAEEASDIKASPDGTIELVNGQITAEPASDNSDVKVDVDGASVTAKKPITITAGGTDEEGNPTEPTVTTTEPTAEVTISPDGDPDHTVVYTGCPEGKEYGIHSGTLTDEDKVEIKEGTEYDLTVSLGDGQTTNIETDSSNPGTTTITKGKDENNQPDGSIVIESDKPNNDITVGDTKYTTSDENTKLVVKPGTGSGSEGGEGGEGGTGLTGKPEVELKEGSVQLPPEGTITLPNGDKVTNSTNPEEGSESVTVSDDNKVRVPAGAEATLGEGDDVIKVSVPKGENGEPDSLPAEVTPSKDGSGYDVKAEPGNEVTIGDETFKIGDYDTTFEVKPGKGEDGQPQVTVSDGGVELQPGQSVTDSNGVTFTNTGDDPIKLSMTEGENTEVTVGEGGSFQYQPEGAEEPITYTNPGSSEADFSVSKDGVSLSSDLDMPQGKAVDVDFLGNNVKVEVPQDNQGQVKIDPTEGTVTIEKAGDKVKLDGKEYTASEDGTVLAPGRNGVELEEGGVKLNPSDSIIAGGTELKNSGRGECEVAVDEDGTTTVKVPKNGGFTMTDPNSGESVSFTNPNAGEEVYKLDDSGSLILPDNSDITFKQGNTSTKIGTEGQNATIHPTENGVEITAPAGGTIKVNDVPFENASGTGEELVIAVNPAGKPVLESGTTEIPEGKQIMLPGGDTITNKNGDITLGADGNLELSEGSKVEIQRDGKTNGYTAAAEPTKLEYDPETGVPTLTQGAVKPDKGSSVDVIFNTIEHGEDSELFDEVEKATVTSRGTQAPTVEQGADGAITITVPKNGAVDIDSEVKKGTGEGATKEKAHNSVSVPAGAPNDSVVVKPNKDGSADIALENAGDVVNVNGMEYTATEEGTQIHITETGSTLKKGGVELDGGKNPKEGINVNGTNVTNSGPAGTTVSVKTNEDGTIGFKVSPGGQFDLAVPGKPESAVTFKNPSDTNASYTIQPDGSIQLGDGSSISFKAGGKDMEVTGTDGVSLKVTEDGVALTVAPGKTVMVGGVTYEAAPADVSAPLVLTIDKNGKTVITSGSVKVPEDKGVNIKKDNGELLAIKKTGDDPEKGDAETITVSEDGKILAYPGDTLTIGDGTYTCNDDSGIFNLTLNPETGEVIVDKGAEIEVTNGNLTFPEGTDGGVTISTTGNKPIVAEKNNGDAKPAVTVPAGGNVTIGSKATGKEIEVKIPDTVSEEKKVTIDNAGNISVDLKEGEQVTIGGVVYKAEQDGALKVNGETGKLMENSIVPDGSTLVPAIDPKSFNKANYEYELAGGESVTVGDVTYTAPEGGMKLLGNENGNPIIQVNQAGAEVQVGDRTYVTGSDDTKFIVNSDNNVTLVDNGKEAANSSLRVDGSKTMTIDGNTISSTGTADGAGYTITKTAGADELDIADGTKVSVSLDAGSPGMKVNGQVSVGGQNTTGESITIKPTASGTGIVLDRTSKDAEENYITKLSSSGSTILTPVKDAEGNMVGFTTSLPAPKPQLSEDEASDDDDDEPEPELPLLPDNPVVTPSKQSTKPAVGTENTENAGEEQEEGAETEPDEELSGEENTGNTAEYAVVKVEQLEEASGITVVEDTRVYLGEGTVSIQAASEEGKLTGDLKDILEACFTPDEIELIAAGTDAEIRVIVVKSKEDVSEEDTKLMQERITEYAQHIEGLEFGSYVDITIERQVGNGGWKKLHELNGETEITLKIPETLMAEGRTYYVERNHEGECTLLEDLDSEDTTITILTDRFSVYAILYRDNVAEDTGLTETNQSSSSVLWVIGSTVILLALIALLFFKKRHGVRK